MNIQDLNKKLVFNIKKNYNGGFVAEIAETENNKELLEDYAREWARNNDYDYCPDCNERMPNEPLVNEGDD